MWSRGIEKKTFELGSSLTLYQRLNVFISFHCAQVNTLTNDGNSKYRKQRLAILINKEIKGRVDTSL